MREAIMDRVAQDLRRFVVVWNGGWEIADKKNGHKRVEDANGNVRWFKHKGRAQAAADRLEREAE